MNAANKICLISGVGPGTGIALARRFAAGGYRIAMLARDAARLSEYEREIEGSKAYACDVSDAAAVAHTVAAVRADMGEPDVLIHNAVRGTFGDFRQIDPSELEKNFQVNTMGLLHLARAVCDGMVARGSGAILVTGNTSALRGKPAFAGFAPSKAAQRILAQAIARTLGLHGVHVAYLLIDAVIDTPWARETFPNMPDDFYCKPAAIAETAWHVAHQDRSAWSFDVEVRPFGEVW